MKKVLILFLLSISTSLFAQPENASIQEKEGESCYVHVVQGGNTLWGIHKLYNVPVEEIVRKNPGVESGIQEGQVLYLPIPKVRTEIKHVVVAGETLFGISRKYNVTVQELLDWNPEAKSGLKVDQELLVISTSVRDTKPVDPLPNPFGSESKDTLESAKVDELKISFKDSIIQHIVMDHETFYSISKRYMISPEKLMEFNGKRNTRIRPGDKLLIPIKQEKIERVDVRPVPEIQLKNVDSTLLFKKKDEYVVVVLLPFYLDKGKGYSEYVSNVSAEFYMGAKMAIDSLEKIGFHAQVHFLDTRNDLTTITGLLNGKIMKSADLVIGPLFKTHQNVVAGWAKENGIRMVSPVAIDMELAWENPLVYAAVPSDITLMKGLAEYTYKKHKTDRLVLIKPKHVKDSLLYQAFRTRFNELAGKDGVKLIETNAQGFTTYLNRSSNVVLIYPTTDKSSVLKFFNEMGRFIHKTSDDKTFVFGTKEWMTFDEVNAFYKNKYKLTFPNTFDLNYSAPTSAHYVKVYRSLYGSDMSKMAFQGFDVTFNFCAELLMGIPVNELLMNQFVIEQLGANNGYENKHVYILTQRDYELLNANSINE